MRLLHSEHSEGVNRAFRAGKSSWRARVWIIAAVCVTVACAAPFASGQAATNPNPSSTPKDQVSAQGLQAPPAPVSPSLAGPLNRAASGQTELNIIYVHGIGINPPERNNPQDFEVSQDFRKSFCKAIHCSTNMYVSRSYASQGPFDANATPPPLKYFGEDLWKQNTGDWRAAAPFVDHYQLVGKVHGADTTIYVHEINWWPLIMSPKCRQIVAPDMALVARDEKHLQICSTESTPDQGNRYKTYAWITNENSIRHDPKWPGPASINRWVKHDLMDWGFADALMAVGPMHRFLVLGIRELVLDSFDPSRNQEFVIVSHSLGSYLMFSVLDLGNEDPSDEPANSRTQFEQVLTQTSHAYFMANQVRLLELANLDTVNNSFTQHLQTWSNLRANAHREPPQIVAWSDPDDLLTWRLPEGDQPAAMECTKDMPSYNCPAINAARWYWLWLFANPQTAHVNYDQNKRVIRTMVPKK